MRPDVELHPDNSSSNRFCSSSVKVNFTIAPWTALQIKSSVSVLNVCSDRVTSIVEMVARRREEEINGSIPIINSAVVKEGIIASVNAGDLSNRLESSCFPLEGGRSHRATLDNMVRRREMVVILDAEFWSLP